MFYGVDCMYTLVGQNFINAIKSIVPTVKIASGGKEIVIRCPFCGDSKNLRHAHFYISVPQSQEDISFYQCKRCPNAGILSDELLRRIGCNDSNIMIEITKHNAEVMSLPKYKSLKKINIYPLKWNLIRKDPNNQIKLDYINKRIGSNFTIFDLAKVKIILNLYDVINTNHLELTRHQMVCNDLDKYFMGFISFDNSYCGLRKVVDKELHNAVNKRYINYSLVNKTDDRKNFYVIPTRIDILDPAPVKIHIAEGQFDTLSIYYNLNQFNDYQNIYMACGGKSYSQALEFILTESGIINYEIHFYPDRDVSDNEFYYDVLRRVELLPGDIYIHRNVFNGEKDFGVPKERIIDSVRVIKDAQVF